MKINCFGLNYSVGHMWSTADTVVLHLHIQKKSIQSLEAKCNYNVNTVVVCVVLMQKCVASN